MTNKYNSSYSTLYTVHNYARFMIHDARSEFPIGFDNEHESDRTIELIDNCLSSGLSVFTELLKNYTVTTLIRCFLLIFVAGCDVH